MLGTVRIAPRVTVLVKDHALENVQAVLAIVMVIAKVIARVIVNKHARRHAKGVVLRHALGVAKEIAPVVRGYEYDSRGTENLERIFCQEHNVHCH